jgi:hypothetical protein
MKKLFLFLAVSGLIFASCGKKAEPTPAPTPAPQETVAPAPAPTPEPAPAATPAPAPEKKATTKEVKKVDTKAIDSKAAPTTKAEVKTTTTTKPVERTLEEKLKHLNEYSPEEQKAIINEAQKSGIAVPGTSTKSKKGTK